VSITRRKWKPIAMFYTVHPDTSLRWVANICTKYGAVVLSTYRNDAGGFEHYLTMYRPPMAFSAWEHGEKSERGLVMMANKFARLCAGGRK